MCLPLPLPLAGAFLPAAHCGQSPGQMPPTGVKCLGGCIVRGQDGGEGAVFGQRTMFRAEAGAVRGWVCEGRSSSTAAPPRGRCFPGPYGVGALPLGPPSHSSPAHGCSGTGRTCGLFHKEMPVHLVPASQGKGGAGLWCAQRGTWMAQGGSRAQVCTRPWPRLFEASEKALCPTALWS